MDWGKKQLRGGLFTNARRKRTCCCRWPHILGGIIFWGCVILNEVKDLTRGEWAARSRKSFVRCSFVVRSLFVRSFVPQDDKMPEPIFL